MYVIFSGWSVRLRSSSRLSSLSSNAVMTYDCKSSVPLIRSEGLGKGKRGQYREASFSLEESPEFPLNSLDSLENGGCFPQSGGSLDSPESLESLLGAPRCGSGPNWSLEGPPPSPTVIGGPFPQAKPLPSPPSPSLFPPPPFQGGENSVFGKQWFCLRETRHFRHFRRFRALRSATPCFCG